MSHKFSLTPLVLAVSLFPLDAGARGDLDGLSVRQQIQICGQLQNSGNLEEMAQSEDPKTVALVRLCANIGNRAAADQETAREPNTPGSQTPNEQGKGGESCDAAYSAAMRSCRYSELNVNTKAGKSDTMLASCEGTRKLAADVANSLAQKAGACLKVADECVSACEDSSNSDSYKYGKCKRLSTWVAGVHREASSATADSQSAEKCTGQIAEREKHPGRGKDNGSEAEPNSGGPVVGPGKSEGTPVIGSNAPTTGGGAIGEGRPQSTGGDSGGAMPSTQSPGTQITDRGDRSGDGDSGRGSRDDTDRAQNDRDRDGRDDKAKDDHDHEHHHHEHRSANANGNGKKLFETMSAMTMGPGIQEQKVGTNGMAPASAGTMIGSPGATAMQAQMQAALAAARAANARANPIKNPSAATTTQAQREAMGRADWSQARPGAAQAAGSFAPASVNYGGGTDFASFGSRAPAMAAGVQGLQPTHVGHFDSSRGNAQLDTPQAGGNQPMYKMITVGDAGGSAGGGGAAMARNKQRRAVAAQKLNLKDYLPNGSQYHNGHSPSGLETNRNQIQPMAKDLFQLVSERFRSRCAQDRLFDCKNHLP